ncbi:MAG: cytochrome c maturation protein CcmE [Anaerolineales bacterium]|nr:cytochrome c maturation protein CcmE [Anaerolineales bacterium]
MQPVKFIIGGVLILAAVGLGFYSFSVTRQTAEYFMTVDELIAEGQTVVGKNIRISGAVIGDTIEYDAQSLTLKFTVAHVTGDNDEIEAQGGLAEVLHTAVTDPTRNHIDVVYEGVMPDLLRDEAQAIMTGTLHVDGTFYAEELLLKCPTRYEEAVPGQVEQASR